VDTVTINTTAAPAGHLMGKVHNSKMRMLSILKEDLKWEYIFDPLSENRITEIAATQFPSEQLTVYSIAKNVKMTLQSREKYVYEELQEVESVL